MAQSKNNMPWYLWFVIPIAALTTWRIFRNTARDANRTTEDLTESESQAVRFFGLFGVKIVAGVAFATPIVLEATLKQVGWLVRNVNDWTTIQNTFTTLSGGNLTIFQAAKGALNTTEYNAFVSLLNTALSQKRIVAKVNYHTLYNVGAYGGEVGENFNAGQFVGRCIAESDKYYAYISQFDGVQYYAEKDFFELKD